MSMRAQLDEIIEREQIVFVADDGDEIGAPSQVRIKHIPLRDAEGLLTQLRAQGVVSKEQKNDDLSAGDLAGKLLGWVAEEDSRRKKEQRAGQSAIQSSKCKSSGGCYSGSEVSESFSKLEISGGSVVPPVSKKKRIRRAKKRNKDGDDHRKDSSGNLDVDRSGEVGPEGQNSTGHHHVHVGF